MMNRIYRKLKELLFSIRKINADQRHAPDFFIIGTQKGGTTSLFYYLSQHPTLNLPKEKEIHYYTKHYQKGMKWYRANFPKKEKSKLSGEATPYYLFHPLVPKKLHQDFPKAKLIVLLRNPVDRAFSHYQMELSLGNDTRTFKEAVAFEMENLKQFDQKILNLEKPYTQEHAHFTYLSRGMYKEQILLWLQYFPKEQFLFLKSEDFFANPQDALDEVYDFLEIDHFEPKDLKPKLQGDYHQLDASSYRELSSFFEKKNEKLSELLRNEFVW